MNKQRIVLLILFMVVAFTPVLAQSMSDEQVIEYVKESMTAGKDQRLIATELARRGVSREQVERVKKLYETQQRVNSKNKKGIELDESRLRKAQQEENVQRKNHADYKSRIRNNRRGDDPLEEQLYQPMNEGQFEGKEPEEKEEEEEEVFGRNIFNTEGLTFEPSMNMATPQNYRLGPGDEVIIDIWGTSQTSIRKEISPDGTFNIDKIGPVNLNGMTVAQANAYMKNVLAKTYSGLRTTDGELNIRVTLGNVRTIQINVMGEVLYPGTYTLSSFSSVFHALYRAGGVNDIGSLRRVQLVRNGEMISEIDVYDFIMQGKLQDDIRLNEGDVVIVPAYELMVKVNGYVKRPIKFEMKKDETLATLIHYAGGFESDAYTRSLRVVRQNGEEYEVNTVQEIDYSVYAMRNGDVITADPILNRFTNKLEIRGAVYRPGIYQLNGSINTVRSLVNEAQGLMGDAFTNRAILQRERENLTTEVIPVYIKGIMDGTEPDIALKKNDILYIPSIHDLEDRGDIQIFGEVAKPGNYYFSDNMTLEDLIIRAGGLKESASTVRVDVSRRIKDAKTAEYIDEIGKTFSFSLKDGFVIEGQQGFVLQPYDQVMVRRSPGYQAQQNVSIKGEVLFGGTYAMTYRGERLSDLLKKAGGATPKAYLKGAKLTRLANESEMKRMADVVKTVNKQFGEEMADSLGIKVDSTFTVGIDLAAAVANPGGKDDLVLREGDVLSVPLLDNTVKINGAVMMPNTVAYKKGESVKYYLNQAGGYGLNAKKTKKFIIYMNGQIARVGSGDKAKVEPGCEIFVPSKNKKRTSIGEVLGYASSIGSLATMFATIGNLIKN